jgi:hypothetical protein
VNQKFGDIGAVRLVFRLVGNQLYRTNAAAASAAARTMRSPAATLCAIRSQNAVAVSGAKGSIKLTEAPPLTQLTRMSVNSGRCSEYRHATACAEKNVVIGNSLKLTTSLCF